MKRIYIVLVIVLSYCSVSAQELDTVPAYKKDPNLPAFLILQPDSSWFSADDLPKYDYTAIVYFSPTCNHCQLMAKDIVAHKDSLKDIFFVFVSYLPTLSELKEFASYYGLDQMPNFRIGRDLKYFLPTFYSVRYTPFTAIYDKNRKLLQVYDPPLRNAVEAADLIRLSYKQ